MIGRALKALAFRNTVRPATDFNPALTTAELPALSYTDSGKLLLPMNYLAGGVTTRASGTSISIAAFQARDSTNAADIISGSAIAKSTNSSWSAGTGNGGLGNGLTAGAPDTWLHVFVIKHTNGTVDAGFDTSATAANLLTASGYTYYRRVGSVLTDSTAAPNATVLTYTQRGSHWIWADPIGTESTAVSATAATTITIAGIPTGFRVEAELNWHATDGNAFEGYISSLDANDEEPHAGSPASAAPSTAIEPYANISSDAANEDPAAKVNVRVNTSAQVRVRFVSTAGGTIDQVNIAALGWIDYLGRFE